MQTLYKRGPDGNAIPGDSILWKAYGPIPDTGYFQHGGKGGIDVPAVVHGWDWSATFGRWSALVTFADGWHGWTFPFKYANRAED